MRLVLASESVSDAVTRILDAILLWPRDATLLQLKAGWQEQQVQVWRSQEKGSSVSLTHCILLRGNRDELRPHLHKQPVPTLHVRWVPVADLESGRYQVDPDAQPGILSALYSLRSYIQREPEIILRFLADMHGMGTREPQDLQQIATTRRTTLPLNTVKEPPRGDGTLTLAEAVLLYRVFFAEDEQIDLASIRRRFLALGCLEAIEEQRPVRGREADRRRVSRAYRYLPEPEPVYE
jgi:hypothetical protein